MPNWGDGKSKKKKQEKQEKTHLIKTQARKEPGVLVEGPARVAQAPVFCLGRASRQLVLLCEAHAWWVWAFLAMFADVRLHFHAAPQLTSSEKTHL